MGILGRFFLKLTLKILLKAKVVLILYAGSKEFVFRLEECKFCRKYLSQIRNRVYILISFELGRI